MPRLLAGCGGFLLAVLWMDLMFDVQVWPHAPGPLPEPVLASIAGYYARVTTAADPMGRAIAAVMTVTLIGVVQQLVRGSAAFSLRMTALACAALAIGTALLRTFPNAVELGSRAAPSDVQSALARSIFRDHVALFVVMAVFVAIQIGGAARPRVARRRVAT